MSDLRQHYRSFLKEGRILLTGHSHQAWPDVAREGLARAFDDAALHVDDKWAEAMKAARAVQTAIADQLGGAPENVALGASTHDLLTRLLSALDWSKGRHLVTTRGEFHSLRRQLTRLAEEGVEVSWVDPDPIDTLAERLVAALRDDTVGMLSSTVLFETSSVVPHLDQAAAAARARDIVVVLDAYHHFSIVPWSPVHADAFVVGGGYKYAQWGEGCGFMRVPADCALRPVITGWFSDFAGLAEDQSTVRYGSTQADRFAGATYDPSSHYRARAVIEHFAAQGLDIETLRAISLRQTRRILDALDGFEVLTPREEAQRGGFVTVRIDDANAMVSALRERGVFVDARRDRLRFGPAPYLLDSEIDEGLRIFRELAA